MMRLCCENTHPELIVEPRVLCFAHCASQCCSNTVAVLLELTELAKPVEMPGLCCNTHPERATFLLELRAGQAG